jgi:phenylacetic acid degradation operon negative regulatory protein
MLFTLYGDYAYPSGRAIGLRAIVAMAARLGIGEVAVRSAVARLARQGWLCAEKAGRRAQYGLTDAGRHLIDEGTRRIYRSAPAKWNGAWCLLTYSIPESRRSLRDRMRRQLAWLGFGAMGGGAYASPRAVSDEANKLLRTHGVEPFARIFRAELRGPGSDADLVRACWDLASIGRRYRAFETHYAPMFARDQRRIRAGLLPDADAFVVRFALTHDFRRFPFIDPDLPKELVPRGWAGFRARSLFERYHALLTDGAWRYFGSVADGD